MKTDDLIEQLSADVRRVRPLARPMRRAALWLALALPPVLLVVAVHGVEKSPAMVFANTRSLIELAAMVATAATAAFAAFQSEIPGADRRWLWLPLVPLALWVLSLGQGCLADYQASGPSAFALRGDGCLAPALVAGVLPAAVMFAMIRRGAPVAPVKTVALAGLGVAAIVNTGMTLFHAGDVSLPVLVWHGGALVLAAVAAGLAGPRLMRWR